MNGLAGMGSRHARAAAIAAAGLVAAFLLLAVACGGGGQSVLPTPTPSQTAPPPIAGCNANPTVVENAQQQPAPQRLNIYPRPQYVPGLVAVRFAAGVTPDILRALARINAQPTSAQSALGFFTYRIPPGNNPASAAAVLSATHGVVEAQPLHALYPQVVPNDQNFGPAPPYTAPYTTPPHASPVQWDMYYIQMPAAWDITQGSASVRIAVIDSGYDANNIDVCSKVVSSAVFDNGNGVQDTAATAQDDAGHGTNVSGIASSATNNFTRFAGVGWNTMLFEVRVFQNPTPSNPNPPGATSLDVAAAIHWAVGNGARVINLSLGANPGTPCDSHEQTEITNAVNQNVTVVVSSGNFGNNVLGDPANCVGVIPVGASAIDDTTNPSSPAEVVAPYSTYANSHTWGLVAPGGNPTPAQLSCTSSPLCDYLQWIDNNWSTTACCLNSTNPAAPSHQALAYGTSMAAPHVAGVVALMLAKNSSLSPAQIASILMNNADDICGSCSNEGAGRLNAFRALQATP